MHFVDQQRHNNRERKAPNQTIQTNQNCISKYLGRLVQPENIPKVRKARPFTKKYALSEIKILKGKRQALHRQVMKNNIINYAGYQHYINIFMLIDIAKNSLFGHWVESQIGISHFLTNGKNQPLFIYPSAGKPAAICSPKST